MSDDAYDDDANSASRTYFATAELALADFQLPLENMRTVRELIALIPHEEVYIPSQSRAYVALVGSAGGRMTVAIHSGYVWGKGDPPATRLPIEVHGNTWTMALPLNRLRDGGHGRAAGRDDERAVCPTCWQALPATGHCDNCD